MNSTTRIAELMQRLRSALMNWRHRTTAELTQQLGEDLSDVVERMRRAGAI